MWEVTVFKAILFGFELFCQAALAPSHLQICLPARILNQRDGLGLSFSDLGIHMCCGPFISLPSLGSGPPSPALTLTTFRAAWRSISAGQGQMAGATDCPAVTNFY